MSPVAPAALAAALLCGACRSPAGGASVRHADAPGEPTVSVVRRLEATAGDLAPGTALPARVESPTFRAVLPDASTPTSVALRFDYLGPTPVALAFASGAVRRQIGLKLWARDGCNVLYVMWHVDPPGGVVVSSKENPGVSTSAACGASGYRRLAPTVVSPVPPVVPGSHHVLAVRQDGRTLSVRVDGRLAWQGALPADAPTRGPAGVRSDNVRFELDLRVPPEP